MDPAIYCKLELALPSNPFLLTMLGMFCFRNRKALLVFKLGSMWGGGVKWALPPTEAKIRVTPFLQWSEAGASQPGTGPQFSGSRDRDGSKREGRWARLPPWVRERRPAEDGLATPKFTTLTAPGCDDSLPFG